MAWKAAEPVFQEILRHPFIVELMDGTLPREKFDWYIRQDILYMREYSRTMNALADRISEPDISDLFRRVAMDNIVAEKELHDSFGLGDPDAKPSETCRLLISHLRDSATEPALEVALAGVLPCFTVYQKTGGYILEHCTREANPYLNWIQTYADEGFENSTRVLTDICDNLAYANSDSVAAMTNAFVQGTEYEWRFWDAAYRMEKPDGKL